MSDRKGLTSPVIRVVPAEDADSPEPYDIQATSADLVAYDITAYKHKWPPMQSAPFLWLSFLGWHASRRTGRIPTSLTYEAFRDSVQECTSAANPTEPVLPTEPDQESG